jgi:hypothetical protein
MRTGGLAAGRRIDVIAIDLDRAGRLTSLQHIENAIEDNN